MTETSTATGADTPDPIGARPGEAAAVEAAAKPLGGYDRAGKMRAASENFVRPIVARAYDAIAVAVRDELAGEVRALRAENEWLNAENQRYAEYLDHGSREWDRIDALRDAEQRRRIDAERERDSALAELAAARAELASR